jgi:hypothetical protein
MLLHGDMGIKMVQRAVRLITVRIGAVIQPLNLVIPSSGSLFHLIAWQRNERVRLAILPAQ